MSGDSDAFDGDRSMSDRDLLFARLAVVNGFVDQQTAEAAGRRVDSAKTLADVLVENGSITPETRRAIEQLLEVHVRSHGDDPQQSLSRLSFRTVSFADPTDAEDTFVPAARRGTPPPPTFGDYEIIESIAEGGMGVVYKARQVKLNRLVALKMIRSGELADDEQVERFYSEARAAAKLDHPGIVPVYEVGEQNGQHFFSMAFVEGASLHERVKTDGPLSAKRAAGILKAVAEAVHFGHEHGIVHRDVKPQNILLDASGSPRVTDFGLAQQGDSEMTVAGQVMGTPSYMSPEQAEGRQAEIGPVSDGYSLGATLYYVLTGRPPFQAASPTETLRQVVDVEPVPPRRLNPDVPRDLETICLKCLRKERSARYATARDLADDLGRWLAGKPIVARRVTSLEKGWMWCKRKPGVVGLIAMLFAVIGIATFIAIRQDRLAVEANKITRAEELVVGLKKAEIEQVPAIVIQLNVFREWADPLLKKQIDESKDGSSEKLRLSLALLPADDGQSKYLQQQLLKADPNSLAVIRDALNSRRREIAPELWNALTSRKEPADRRFNAACVLATYDPDNPQKWQPVLPWLADQLVETLSRNPRDFSQVMKSLEPIRKRLAGKVALIARDGKRRELPRETALNIVLEYAADDPKQLVEALAYSEQSQFDKTCDKLAALKAASIPYLTAVVRESWTESTLAAEKERIAKRQANAALALLRLGEPAAFWPMLKFRPDPQTRTYIIHWAAPLGLDPQVFIQRFRSETDTSIRRVLLLALGQFNEKQLPVSGREPFIVTLLAEYETDPDPGLHGCAEWLLRRWGKDESINHLRRKLQTNEAQRKARKSDDGRHWYVTSQGHSMAVLTAGVVHMGSPESELKREDDEKPHRRKIDRTFAIGAQEVTKEQFRRFQLENLATIQRFNIDQYSPTDDCPQIGVDWYDAAAYCNWLSRKEGISKDQWCYEPNSQGKYAAGMKPRKNYLQLTGYRLPSEAEWEYACRAGTTTARYYGLSDTLLPQYSHYDKNAHEHTWPVGRLMPNDFGIFDMFGNAFEWCHEGFTFFKNAGPNAVVDELTDERPLTNDGFRVLRGGSFLLRDFVMRSANRHRFQTSLRSVYFGFRVSRTLR